MNVRKN